MAVRIIIRTDTTANWTAANPILAKGELGLASDVAGGELRVGNGTSRWLDLVPIASAAVMLAAGAASAAAAAANDAVALAVQAAADAAQAARDAQDALATLIESGSLPGNGGAGGGGGGIGTITSVNGVEPDDDGAVVIDAASVGAIPVGYAFQWVDLQGKPTTYTPSAHSHPLSGVEGLAAALADKVIRRGVGQVGLWPAGFDLPATGMQAGDYFGKRTA